MSLKTSFLWAFLVCTMNMGSEGHWTKYNRDENDEEDLTYSDDNTSKEMPNYFSDVKPSNDEEVRKRNSTLKRVNNALRGDNMFGKGLRDQSDCESLCFATPRIYYLMVPLCVQACRGYIKNFIDSIPPGIIVFPRKPGGSKHKGNYGKDYGETDDIDDEYDDLEDDRLVFQKADSDTGYKKRYRSEGNKNVRQTYPAYQYTRRGNIKFTQPALYSRGQ